MMNMFWEPLDFDVPAGSYTLTTTFLGYADKSETLSVTAASISPAANKLLGVSK